MPSSGPELVKERLETALSLRSTEDDVGTFRGGLEAQEMMSGCVLRHTRASEIVHHSR